MAVKSARDLSAQPGSDRTGRRDFAGEVTGIGEAVA